MLAVLDGKGKTLMLIIPDLGMGHSVRTVLNQRDSVSYLVGWARAVVTPNLAAATAGLSGHHGWLQL